MHDKNCIFCKIINKEIPSSIVYEDDDVMAFLDISQTTKGHTLVIPKDHYQNFLATPSEVSNKVMEVAKRIGMAQIDMLHAEGVNILTNVNEAAGQSVMHFHVHVIPRYANTDGFKLTFEDNSEKDLNLPSIATKINQGLK